MLFERSECIRLRRRVGYVGHSLHIESSNAVLPGFPSHSKVVLTSPAPLATIRPVPVVSDRHFCLGPTIWQRVNRHGDSNWNQWVRTYRP